MVIGFVICSNRLKLRKFDSCQKISQTNENDFNFLFFKLNHGRAQLRYIENCQMNTNIHVFRGFIQDQALGKF